MGTIIAPWKQLLLNALESNSHLRHSFATVGCNGKRSNCTMVFRGFQENSNKFQINNDNKSHKIEELKHFSFAEICWYFTDSWEQFRISGTIDVIDGSNPDTLKLHVKKESTQQREKSWLVISVKSRLKYLGPNPGLPCISEHPNQEIFLDPSTGPVGAFCLLLLDPDQVDYLNLKNNERLKFISTLGLNGVKSWSSERINP